MAVKTVTGSRVFSTKTFTHTHTHTHSHNSYYLIPSQLNSIEGQKHTTERQSSILTCQWCVGEVLRLAALPLAVDDVEVHFDRVANGRVSVGRHLHKQHIL